MHFLFLSIKKIPGKNAGVSRTQGVWFIYFFECSLGNCNCIKFYHFGNCVTDLRYGHTRALPSVSSYHCTKNQVFEDFFIFCTVPKKTRLQWVKFILFLHFMESVDWDYLHFDFKNFDTQKFGANFTKVNISASKKRQIRKNFILWVQWIALWKKSSRNNLPWRNAFQTKH